MAMRRNPFEEIEQFFDRMSDQFEESADLPVRMRGRAAVDVLDRGDEFEVRVDLPGYEKEDVELTLTDETLRVAAEREAEEADYVRRERGEGSVDRTVTLPEPVEEDGAEATLSDGVLSVRLVKQIAGEDSRTIDIE